ncbi:hypothetical protein, partial [Xanthomonas hortorum]|uniref:hypothetical protein n=1 Tax=Xanthomonas hortorum TaxID=56454 RepID=UPI001CA514C7
KAGALDAEGSRPFSWALQSRRIDGPSNGARLSTLRIASDSDVTRLFGGHVRRDRDLWRVRIHGQCIAAQSVEKLQ